MDGGSKLGIDCLVILFKITHAMPCACARFTRQKLKTFNIAAAMFSGSRKRKRRLPLGQGIPAKVQRPSQPLSSLSNLYQTNSPEERLGETQCMLAPAVLDSIFSASGVELEGGVRDGSDSMVVPILHPHTTSNPHLDQILQTRNTTFGLSGCVSGCVFIGALTCQLEGYLDLGGILRDGCHCVHLNLVLGKFGEEEVKWRVRLEVGDMAWYLPVNMDSLLAKVPIEDLEEMLTFTLPLVKLFLPHDSNGGAIKTLPLEFWATEKICNSDSPSDLNAKGHFYNKPRMEQSVLLLVKLLHPGSLKEQGLVEGVWEGVIMCRLLSFCSPQVLVPSTTVPVW